MTIMLTAMRAFEAYVFVICLHQTTLRLSYQSPVLLFACKRFRLTGPPAERECVWRLRLCNRFRCFAFRSLATRVPCVWLPTVACGRSGRSLLDVVVVVPAQHQCRRESHCRTPNAARTALELRKKMGGSIAKRKSQHSCSRCGERISPALHACSHLSLSSGPQLLRAKCDR